METGDPVSLPLDNPAFIAVIVVIIAICVVIFKRLLRLERWAESRKLRWHWMGGSAFYLWPEDERDRNPPSLVWALLVLAAVLALAGVLYLLSTG